MSAVAAHVRPYQPKAQQNTPAAFVLAVAMHALLVAALWVSVQWRVEPSGPVVVELWGALPEPAVVAPPPPPPPVPVQREPEKPDADIVVQQEKKRQAELKRLEEERREAERKAEAEKKRREDEAKRLAEEKKQLEAERKKQAEAMARAQQLRREEANRDALRKSEQERMLKMAGSGEQPAAVAGTGRGDPSYAAQLVAIIKPRIVFAVPEGTPTSVYADFQVDLLPTGEILSVKRLKASGLPGYDDAVERAIRRTDPFPRKRDGSVDRSVIIRFRPVDAQ